MEAHYSLPYNVSSYDKDLSSYFDTERFSMIPTSGSALTAPLVSGDRDRAVATLRKKWKNCCGRGAPTLRAACREMDSPLVRCREKDGYQQRLAALLAVARRRSTVPTVLTFDLIRLAENLGHRCFVAGRPYWAK